MRYLIDTHVFIWLMENSKKISPEIKTFLQDPSIDVLISIVSIWEIVIKQAKGLLKSPKDIEGSISEAGFKVLPLEVSHVLKLKRLPDYHQDPFDRILIAQALAENLTLITADPKIWKYKLKLLKA